MEKYLNNYAEPEVAALDGLHAWLPAGFQWSDLVVIPACNENSDFLRSRPPADGLVLMILVINQTPSATEAVSQANQGLAADVMQQTDIQWRSADTFTGFELVLLREPEAARNILLVDKFNRGRQLPPKGGVGHARKIGGDLAAGLINLKRIESRWIRCTDADVQMPDSYFNCTRVYPNSNGKVSTLIYPFHHRDDQITDENYNVVLSTRLYELSLRYYVAAMKLAGSPYAFHTIGSTIAVDADHYAKVRGVPKREAGEDFYLLNKLAKSGNVVSMKVGPGCQAIEIESRLSDRVPFGTGAAVNKMTALQDVLDDYGYYDPRVFKALGFWLKCWPTIWEAGSCKLTSEVFDGIEEFDLDKKASLTLLQSLKFMKVEMALQHAFKQSKSLYQFTRQMDIWFDAFRSLKLIHALRDDCWPSFSFADLSQRAEFIELLYYDEDLRDFYQQLQLR
jgi:hypothetical protein